MATRHRPEPLKWQFKLRHIGFKQLLSAKLYRSYLKTKTRPIVSDGRVLSGRREPRYGRWLPALAHSRLNRQLQPLVEPQVSHFRQVPLRTMVKLPHSAQLSPS